MACEENIKIGIIGLGYVGLPLALAFAQSKHVIGFDINKDRVRALKNADDWTLEVTQEALLRSKNLIFSYDESDMKDCTCFIITVPTPINSSKQPDLKPLLAASKLIGSILKIGDTVIYESTVYPGATEEECIPALEASSSLKFNKDFYVGYSPERINPGDKKHSLKDIVKVTSGSNEDTALFVDKLYNSIIEAGTFPVSSIKVAEAAKVIENTQRDVNIGLINELAIIFNRLSIDTEEVLLAAGSKWNFIPFRPGLVGGHCIGVDPYYLTFKAQAAGYFPEIILAGRRLNDGMGEYIALELVKHMLFKKMHINGARILIMGLTFKENCPDIRNTRVVDIISSLNNFGAHIECFDPWVQSDEALSDHGVEIIEHPKENFYDSVIVAVAHQEFINIGIDKIHKFCKKNHIVYDLKYLFSASETDLRL